MALALVFAGGARVRNARHAFDDLHRAQVGQHVGILRQAVERAVFERGLDWRHVLAVPGLGQHHLLDARSAVALHGDLCQELAVAARIECPACEARQAIEQVEGDLFLLAEGNVAQLDQERHVANQVLCLDQRHMHSQVTGTAKVFAVKRDGFCRQRGEHRRQASLQPVTAIGCADVVR